MADEVEAISTGAEASAGENTPAQQAPESTSQEAAGEQSSGGGQQVDTASTVASSGGRSGREGKNSYWANQRLIEKTVRQALQEQLSPQLEELKKSLTPRAPEAPAGADQVDWNNLPGWLNQRVQQLINDQLSKNLPQTLNQFKGQLESQLTSKTRMQEARNYLISQKDIGRDDTKLAEVRKVMEDNYLDYALEHDPIGVVEKAVDIWRKTRVNPNAPPKGHLSTVSGGAGTQPKGEASVDQIRELQQKVAAGGLTMDEQEKLFSQIDSLVFGK